MLKVGVLDIETSYGVHIWPWMKESYLSTVGLQIYNEGHSYYKDWVFTHDQYNEKQHGAHLQSLFDIQAELNRLDLLVGHNFKFDMDWMKWKNVSLDHLDIWDTKLAQYMIMGQDKSFLGMLGNLNACCEHWDIEGKDDKVKTYWDAGRDTRTIPLNVLLPYQKQDVLQTGALFKKQYRYLGDSFPSLLELVRIRNKCLHPVTEIECNGMPFHRERAEFYVKEFQGELEITDAELHTYFGLDDLNLNSGVELSAGLFGGTVKRERYIPHVYTRNCTIKDAYQFTYQSGKLKGQTVTKYKNRTVRELTCRKRRDEYEISIPGVGFIPDPKSETASVGVYATNKQVLKNLKCNGKGTSIKTKRRILELLLHRSKIGKFTETFVGAKKDTGLFYRADLNIDGRLHPSYNQTVAATGRFTSSNPNGQNFPRSKEDEDGFTNPLKRCFIPSRTGGLILVVDLSQLEWRIAAWLSQDPVALKEIWDGVDIHLDNAIKFFGDAKYRQVAKIMTFRLLYGGSAYAFYMDPSMPDFSQKKWNTIVEQYGMKYSRLIQWQMNNITAVGKNNGMLISPTGRLYSIPQVENKRYPGVFTFSDTCIKNYPVQGTATGDVVPLAMDMIWDQMILTPEKYVSTNWMGQVHDSVIFDTMPHEVKQTAFMCIQQFEELPNMINKIWGLDVNVPLTGEAEWGPNYGELTSSVKHVGGEWILKEAA